MRTSRRWMVAGAGLVVVAVAGTILWLRSAADVPRLQYPADAAFGIAVPYSGNPAPWSFGSITLCTDKPGSVTITKLTPVGGSGLSFVGMGTRPASHDMFGDSQRSLAAEGFATPAVVSAVCAIEDGPHTELGVQVAHVGTGDGRFEKMKVEYVSAGKHETLTIPWTLKVCGSARTTNDSCGGPFRVSR